MDTPLADLWYEVVEDATLRQGDIIRNVVVFAFPQDLPVLNRQPEPEEQFTVKADWLIADWIVMSASCDVDRETRKYPWVLVGRIFPATSEKLGDAKGTKLKQTLEVIRKGLDPQRFLLAPHPGDPELPLSFAEYRPHVTVPKEYLVRASMGKRLRLRPPYRESFGNWVGSNFARVGVEDVGQIPKQSETSPPGTVRLELANHVSEVPTTSARKSDGDPSIGHGPRNLLGRLRNRMRLIRGWFLRR